MYVAIVENKNVIRENVSAHTHKITKLLQGKYAPLSPLRCNISSFFFFSSSFCASSSSMLFSVIKTNRLFPFSSLFPLSAIYLPCKINEIYAKLYTKSHIIVWENCEQTYYEKKCWVKKNYVTGKSARFQGELVIFHFPISYLNLLLV